MQQCDALLAHDTRQIGRILVATGACHVQPGAAQQRQEKLPDRHIKSERSLLQNVIGLVYLVFIADPEQQVDHATVFAQNPFRGAGRTGRINHISQVSRSEP
ncbi:hypothetical protein PFLU3_57160 [Pseudomonas fluorescens]|uniref:Uncharacterized protein n=1 Tax=Pseudomonas fluorescens TaxID=294 RepID=A0A0D0R2W2_PSEFL|nr:hypothetical protein PFLU3_57160 [Pseudomonas fluorescens]